MKNEERSSGWMKMQGWFLKEGQLVGRQRKTDEAESKAVVAKSMPEPSQLQSSSSGTFGMLPCRCCD